MYAPTVSGGPHKDISSLFPHQTSRQELEKDIIVLQMISHKFNLVISIPYRIKYLINSSFEYRLYYHLPRSISKNIYLEFKKLTKFLNQILCINITLLNFHGHIKHREKYYWPIINKVRFKKKIILLSVLEIILAWDAPAGQWTRFISYVTAFVCSPRSLVGASGTLERDETLFTSKWTA